MLDEAQRDRIEAAVHAAEQHTSGEIVCVYERRLERDATTPWLAAALAALALPPLLLVAYSAWSPSWQQEPSGQLVLLELVITQIVVFTVVYLLTWLPGVLRAVTPGALRRVRVHRAALQHFLSRGVHQTRDRTGVLIFVVEEERAVEIVADSGIYAKVAPTMWADAVKTLTEGLRSGDAAGGIERAVEACGKVLAEHFPPRPDDEDELANRVVVLD